MGKKKKGGRKKGGDSDDDEVAVLSSAPVGDLEESDNEAVKEPVPAKKKKDTSSFMALADDDDEEDEDEDDDEEEEPVPAKKKKDTSSFMALADDDEEEDEDEDDDEEEEPVPAKKKKDTSSFMALADDDDEDEDEDDDEEEEPVPAKKKKDTSSFMALADDDEEEDEDEDDDEEEEPVPAKKKKDTSSFMALADDDDEEDEDEDDDEEEEPVPAKKKDTSSFMALADDDDDDDHDEGENEEEHKAVPVAAKAKKPPPNKKGKKKGKGGKNQEDDEMALLEAAIAANTVTKPTSSESKGEKDAKGNDDEMALLDAAIEANSSNVTESTQVQEDSTETGIDRGGKKARKRGGKKKKGGAAEPAAEELEPTAAKQTARGKAIAKAMEEKRLKEEKEEAERVAKLKTQQEEEERLAEEERLKEDAKLEKKRLAAEKKAEMKAQGLLKTKKQKEQEAAAARRAEMLRAQGLAPSAVSGDGAEGQAKKGKVVYAKKKKKNEPKPAEQPRLLAQAGSELAAKPETEPEAQPVEEDDTKDAWDDSSDDDWEKVEDKSEETAAPPEEPEKLPAVVEKPKAAKLKPPPGEEELRSPICCILGHVDTGKTKLLDKIRSTNVQDGEAGGITQQIGATYFPVTAIEKATKRLRERRTKMQIKVPGLLIIDTPGHESFSNLRQRGSSLCDIAILVVDITGGLEKQTIESLNLLREKKVPFVVALNKIDRMYEWKVDKDAPFEDTFTEQPEHVKHEFNERVKFVISEFANQGLNACLYTENRDYDNFVSLVPTSAHSGEGIPDLLGLISVLCQRTLVDSITYQDEIEATVLEVKKIEGHGTTIDIILINGEMHANDEIVVCGMNGPIHTTIRALMTPQPMKEIRVKGSYVHHKSIKAAMGIKIAAPGLEQAIAGTPLLVVGEDDDVEDIKQQAEEELERALEDDHRSEHGVYVQASTLGALEALLTFLRDDCQIPYSAVNIGPVHKRDVMKASTMLAKAKEHAVILAFDVKIEPDVHDYADELGVTIFSADIIYHLFDMFTAYRRELREAAKEEAAAEAVFPVVLQIYEQHIFNSRNPILVLEGQAKLGTPICIPSADFISLGRIVSMEKDHKEVDTAVKGDDIACKIEQSASGQEYYYGRHFNHTDKLMSKISRDSIDLLKQHFRDEMTAADWNLVKKLKPIFKIQ